MTASASVVEELLDAAKSGFLSIVDLQMAYAVECNGWEWPEDAPSHVDIPAERLRAAIHRATALNLHPAEQDAREAVAWRVKDYAGGWILFHHEAPARKSAEARNGALVQPLYAALTQAAPDGWRPIDVDALAQEIRRVDGNHDLGAGALAEALMPFLSASPAPPAQGAGG